MQHQPQASALSRTVSYFAHTLSGIGVFLLVPWIEQNLRPDIFGYFYKSFSQDVSLWASWGFVIVATLCLFFGASVLLQIVIQIILRLITRWTLF